MPELVLLNLSMPRGHGFEIAMAIIGLNPARTIFALALADKKITDWEVLAWGIIAPGNAKQDLQQRNTNGCA
jgi:hypothetical protein